MAQFVFGAYYFYFTICNSKGNLRCAKNEKTKVFRAAQIPCAALIFLEVQDHDRNFETECK